jgi:pumilio homology domain family member 6
MTMSTTAHQTKTRKSGSAGGGGGGGKKEHGGSGGSGASTAGDQTNNNNNNKRRSPGGGGGKEGHGAGGASSSSFSNKKKSKPSSSTTATSTAAATKRQLKHERQSTRKHADIVQESKSIWNQLRLKTNTKDDTQKLTDQLMKLIMTTSSNNTNTDKKMIVTEIALQHDASRCVQAAIQFGTTQQRRLIVTELTATPGNLAELSKSLYAQFVVLKMIQYCCKDDVCVTKMTRNIKGHLVKMATHAVASKVVESLFNKLTSKQMAVLKQEFYGPQFSLFATASSNDVQTTSATNSSSSHAANNKKIPDLEANLILAPEKTTVTLEFVLRFVHTCMEKSLYGYEYFQTLLSEYCTMASPVELRQLVSGTTVAHNAIHLLASRSGTRALSYLIAYATAKDRKAMLKSIKGAYGISIVCIYCFLSCVCCVIVVFVFHFPFHASVKRSKN